MCLGAHVLARHSLIVIVKKFREINAEVKFWRSDPRVGNKRSYCYRSIRYYNGY